jgi:uncharacterized protein (TIGR02611 family)
MRRGGAALKRAVLEVLGWALVAGGIAAIFLPGPGLLMLFGGLAILSQQYEWAERRVRPVERAAMKAASDGVQSWTRVTLSFLGCCWLGAMGALWLWNPDAPDWWPLPEMAWLPGGPTAGITLVASALIALGLLVYSFRRFRGSPYVPKDEREAQPA